MHMIGAARMCIPVHWKSTRSPTTQEWFHHNQRICDMDELILSNELSEILNLLEDVLRLADIFGGFGLNNASMFIIDSRTYLKYTVELVTRVCWTSPWFKYSPSSFFFPVFSSPPFSLPLTLSIPHFYLPPGIPWFLSGSYHSVCIYIFSSLSTPWDSSTA